MDSFLSNTKQTTYNKSDTEVTTFDNLNEIILTKKECNSWLNTYGINYKHEFEAIIKQSSLDDFLIKLLNEDQHPNKVLELNNILFIAVNILKTDSEELTSEQIFFILNKEFIWTIQEKKGDHFEWIRTRINENKGLVRKKNIYYLLYLLIESIIDNYSETYRKFQSQLENELDVSKVDPTPDFTSHIQEQKKKLFQYKKACVSLRDVIIKLEKTLISNNKIYYFSELKEQLNNLISDIDFEISNTDSNVNLIFSIQGHYLNNVMKTLTIFSVIFIPITFIAGLYGMNFKYIPELQTEYGYFIALIVMFLLTSVSLYIFKKKNWF
jgi:magnesium transporter